MYKTILVHIDGSPEQESRLRVAVLLADEHEAHLVGSAATGMSWAASPASCWTRRARLY